MFFNDGLGLVRVIVVGCLAYAALLILVHLSGKRTLSKMNAFDLVVTVALGATLATVLLARDVALAEGVLAFALLIALQFIITGSAQNLRGVSGRGQSGQRAGREELLVRRQAGIVPRQ